MESDRSSSRIDTLKIKSLIYQKLGHHRAEQYFVHLGRLLTLKINKSEFDKLCIKTIGRENIPLHNHLLRSLIKNASVARSPPPKSIRKFGNDIKLANGYRKSPLQSRKFRDRPSPLGPLGKPQSVNTNDESVSKAQSATELCSLGSRPPVEVVSVEEGEEVEQIAGSPSFQSRSSVTAPFGVSVNFKGEAKRSLSNRSTRNSSLYRETSQDCGELPDSRTLKSRLERKLEMEGVRVSTDCVNLLNNGLDAYLKRLIEPCLSLARSHSRFHASGTYTRGTKRSFHHVTMLDFCTGMELNPQLLGEDWPIQLEKIRSHASDD